MDSSRFDAWTRGLVAAIRRRTVLQALLGLGTVGLFASAADAEKKKRSRGNVSAEGKRKKKRKGKKKRNKCRPKCAGKNCGPNGCGKTCGSCHSASACQTGRCVACTVCAEGCEFNTVQAAIDASEPGATINLCPDNYKELLVTNRSFTLVGLGATRAETELNAVERGTVLTITGSPEITLRNLSIMRGLSDSTAGGIVASGDLTLENIEMVRNEGVNGGAIYSTANLILTNSEVRNNIGQNGAGLYLDGGDATLNRTRLVGNEAAERGGGVFVAGSGVRLTLNDSSVRTNTALGASSPAPLGGGILNQGEVDASGNSRVVNNTPSQCDNAAGGTGCP